ncbi:hypothetical protein GR158_12175 [Shinella sp. AETb1-6]|uniref:hypothetical protein n=1 Tax=Shinella sp. AETb1-6 TaxID=2692210 RepID=UPI0013708819|nr:hypothetical protein [Shinella sp. AETb1-6]MXN51879.1 hypothetical protein [Shinella sp. AETb1-6]
MIGEPHTIPDDMAARVARLINEAEDMRQQAADDLKQIYADLREELRGLGWDGKHVSAEVAALKGAIGEMRLDEKAKEKREEKGERVDDYVSLLTRARAREGNSYSAARRSDAGLSILTKHEDIRTAPVTAEEITRPAHPAVSGGEPSIPSTDAGGVKMGGSSHPGRPDATTSGLISAKSERATNTNSQSDDGAIAEVKGSSARLANAAGVEPPSSDRQSDQPGEGGAIVVTSSAPGAGDETQTSNTGEGAANAALPAKPKVSFRPNCQHPENCASGTRDHCWSCRRAMQKSEEMA